MNDDVRMPIMTIHDGEETTKICVEDMYKAVNRVIEAYNNFVEYAEDQFDEIGKREVDLSDNGVWLTEKVPPQYLIDTIYGKA